MKSLLRKSLIGEKIGDWIASETPDGVIMWSQAKKKANFLDALFYRPVVQSKTIVMATPHYDIENEVIVEVIPNASILDDNNLQTRFKLIGNDAKIDRAYYIARMEIILSILK